MSVDQSLNQIQSNIEKPIIVALDYPDIDQAMSMASQLDPNRCRVKVGKELYTRSGPSIIEKLMAKDFDIFLDLKFHDIPNTVAKAVRAAAEMGVWMVNVHASGGRQMMERAREELSQVSNLQTLLIGVTVLTSMQRKDLQEIGLDIDPIEHVKRLADLTQKSGLDGIVCSAQEVSLLREHFDASFSLVTPGIRMPGDNSDDQQRIMTPGEAMKLGSSYIVVGRPITKAADPMLALKNIEENILSYN